MLITFNTQFKNLITDDSVIYCDVPHCLGIEMHLYV